MRKFVKDYTPNFIKLIHAIKVFDRRGKRLLISAAVDAVGKIIQKQAKIGGTVFCVSNVTIAVSILLLFE